MKKGALILLMAVVGCGTTRMSDSRRTATEQQLISHAVDLAVSQLDFRPLACKRVFLDEEYVDKSVVDPGYLISTLRQQILASGCLLQSDKNKATFIIEARCGGLGTDRHDVLIGVPAMSLPTILPGQPSQIPEIPFAKKSDQHGLAKLAVYAYHRATGGRVWQSGLLKARSSAKDLWLLGAGPFQHGTIRSRVELAGEQITVPFILEGEDGKKGAPPIAVSDAKLWLNKRSPGQPPRMLRIGELARIFPLGAQEASPEPKVIQANHEKPVKVGDGASGE